MTSMVAGRMAEAAPVDRIPGSGAAPDRLPAVSGRGGAPPVVLHPDRSWRPAARRHGPDPASQRSPAGRDRPVHARLRHRRPDHGLDNILDSSKAGPSTSAASAVATRALLHHDLRRAGGALPGLALRRAPCSLHYTIIGGEVAASTPTFLGADPADSPLLGPHLHRPLAAAEDLGRELFRSLDEPRRARALVSPVRPRIWSAATTRAQRQPVAADRRHLPPAFKAGSPSSWPTCSRTWKRRSASTSSPRCHELQRRAEGHSGPGARCRPDLDPAELLGCYLARLPDQLADQQAGLVDHEFGLTFLWAGSAERGQPHYYRIQGERVLIEYDNSQRGANHVHTVWRDLAGDFGGDALARRYAKSATDRIADGSCSTRVRAPARGEARVYACRSGLCGGLRAEVGVEVAARSGRRDVALADREVAEALAELALLRAALEGRRRDLRAGSDHRQMGSTALMRCHLADGRPDGCLTGYCNSWDVIGGLLLVQEAGGMASDFIAETAWRARQRARRARPACRRRSSRCAAAQLDS